LGHASYVLPFIVVTIGVSMALPCMNGSWAERSRALAAGEPRARWPPLQQLAAVVGITIVTAVFDAKVPIPPYTTGCRAALCYGPVCPFSVKASPRTSEGGCRRSILTRASVTIYLR
jgi:hypothetical protein